MKTLLTLLALLILNLPSYSQEEVLCDQMNDLEIGKMIMGVKIAEVGRVLDSCGCTYSITEKFSYKYNLMLNSKNGGVKHWVLEKSGHMPGNVITDIEVLYIGSISSDMLDIVEYNVFNEEEVFKEGKLMAKRKIGRRSSRLNLKYR